MNDNREELKGSLFFDRYGDEMEFEYRVIARNKDDMQAAKELIEKIKSDLEVIEQIINTPNDSIQVK